MKITILEKLISLGFEEKKARSLIMAGQVFVKTNKILVASEKIDAAEEVVVKDSKE